MMTLVGTIIVAILILISAIVKITPFVFGIYLISRHSIILRSLGWAVLVIVFFYSFTWTGQWAVTYGADKVQVIETPELRFGNTPFVHYLAAPARVVIEPQPNYVFIDKDQKVTKHGMVTRGSIFNISALFFSSRSQNFYHWPYSATFH